jgi:hypothetical protein
LDVPDGVLASDDAGVVINAGAYSTVPEWSEFYFDSDAGEAVKGTSSTEWNKSFKNNNIASKPKTSDPREDTDEDTDFASDLI